MTKIWHERNTIVANLFNPAFCGEILRVAADSYNSNCSTKFPYAYSFIILPILLHKPTRDKMPRSTKTYFFVWVEQNDGLFFDFAKRTKSMVKYTKEALLFLLAYKRIELNGNGEIETFKVKSKIVKDENHEEFNEIIKRAEMLGKWLSINNDVKSIYSFLRIMP